MVRYIPVKGKETCSIDSKLDIKNITKMKRNKPKRKASKLLLGIYS